MLDPMGRREVMQAAMKLRQEKGITVIFITHYMEEALMADRVVVMDSGTVVDDGTPREIFRKVEMLRGIGLEVPPMAELAYRLREGGMEMEDGFMETEEMAEALWQLM